MSPTNNSAPWSALNNKWLPFKQQWYRALQCPWLCWLKLAKNQIRKTHQRFYMGYLGWTFFTINTKGRGRAGIIHHNCILQMPKRNHTIPLKATLIELWRQAITSPNYDRMKKADHNSFELMQGENTQIPKYPFQPQVISCLICKNFSSVFFLLLY